jgi:hypothetical protein
MGAFGQIRPGQVEALFWKSAATMLEQSFGSVVKQVFEFSDHGSRFLQVWAVVAGCVP